MRHGLIVSATLILVIVLLSACTPRTTESVEATALPAATSTLPPAATSTSLPAAVAATSTPQTVNPTVAPVEAAATSVATATVFQATAELSASEVEALNLALQDEYKALATYERVIMDHGSVAPFSSIAGAEGQHIASLKALFDTYGLEIPVSEWAAQVPSFSSLSEACAGGVQAEIENAALYDQLFPMTTHPDITLVFEQLQAASLEQHLPAFERCATR
jgi:hypothetical protein